jgi:hypothetical protein
MQSCTGHAIKPSETTGRYFGLALTAPTGNQSDSRFHVQARYICFIYTYVSCPGDISWQQQVHFTSSHMVVDQPARWPGKIIAALRCQPNSSSTALASAGCLSTWCSGPPSCPARPFGGIQSCPERRQETAARASAQHRRIAAVSHDSLKHLVY